MEIMDEETKRLYEEAREWAVAELLAKHLKELKELHSEHFRRLTKRETDKAQTDETSNS